MVIIDCCAWCGGPHPTVVNCDRATRTRREAVSDIEPYPTMLRLIRKYGNEGESLGRIFIRVGLALEEVESPKKRDDLAKMLSAWKFWEELGELQSELLDCIEHVYGFTGPSDWSGFIKARESSVERKRGK